MKLTVHVEGSAEECAAQLTEVAATLSGGEATPAPGKSGGKKKAGGKKAAPAKDEDEDVDYDEDVETDDEDIETDEDTDDVDGDDDVEADDDDEPAPAKKSKHTAKDVLVAFQKYIKSPTGSPEKAKKILAKFKVKKVDALKPAQYGDVMALLKKV